MHPDATSALGPGQLARLLALGMEGPQPEDERRAAADVLRGMLAGELPLDTDTPDSLPALLGELDYRVWDAVGHGVGELLLDAQTDLPSSRTQALEAVISYQRSLGGLRLATMADISQLGVAPAE